MTKNALRDHGGSDDGCNGATDTVATVRRAKDGTRQLHVCAEDIVQSQAGGSAESDREEAVASVRVV